MIQGDGASENKRKGEISSTRESKATTSLLAFLELNFNLMKRTKNNALIVPYIPKNFKIYGEIVLRIFFLTLTEFEAREDTVRYNNLPHKGLKATTIARTRTTATHTQTHPLTNTTLKQGASREDQSRPVLSMEVAYNFLWPWMIAV